VISVYFLSNLFLDPLNYGNLPYDPLHYLDSVIYDHEINILPHPTLPMNLYQQSMKPQCTNGHEMIGRWVRLNDTTKKCPSWACYVNKHSSIASPIGIKWLTDQFHFNQNYIWVPLNCSFQLFSPSEIKLCLVKKNITDLLFVGDSLLREHFQNIVSYLFPGYYLQRLQGTLVTLHFSIPRIMTTKTEDTNSNINPNRTLSSLKSQPQLPLPPPLGDTNDTFLLRVHYSYDPPLHAICSFIDSNSTLLLWNLHIIRFMNRGKLAFPLPLPFLLPSFSLSELTDISGHHLNAIKKNNWTKDLGHHLHLDTCSSQSLPSNTYLIHPRIQRLDPRVPRNGNPHRGITPLRQDLINTELVNMLKIAFINTTSILHGISLTNSRWESSWDGIHYSVLAHESDFQTITVTGLNGLNQTNLDVNVVTNSSQYRRGGRDVCHLKQYPYTHNVCSNGTMYWKSRVIARSNTFDSFQGGVSRMLTMMWINSFCHVQ
jgi:hypothetical protein